MLLDDTWQRCVTKSSTASLVFSCFYHKLCIIMLLASAFYVIWKGASRACTRYKVLVQMSNYHIFENMRDVQRVHDSARGKKSLFDATVEMMKQEFNPKKCRNCYKCDAPQNYCFGSIFFNLINCVLQFQFVYCIQIALFNQRDRISAPYKTLKKINAPYIQINNSKFFEDLN